MNDMRSIFILLLTSVCVTSCTNDSSSTVIELQSAVSARTDAALRTDGGFQIDISINSGPLQTFLFETLESSVPVVVSGVRANEENSIDITWYKILDGSPVEISLQSQVFVANENALINAPHNHTLFDYDNDGISNLSELEAGTCILSPIEGCMDVRSDNLLLNGDFEDGTEHWWVSHETDGESIGELCATSPATALFSWDSQMAYAAGLQLEPNSRYTFAFDVRAQTIADILLSIHLPELNFLPLFEDTIEVSTTGGRRIMRFDTGSGDFSEVGLSFGIGNGTDNIYCFDNLELTIEDVE